MSHVRYLFADCRWALDDPGLGRRLYLEGHIPGAAFLDVEQDLAAQPGATGRHPLPTADRFAAAASRAGIEGDVFVVAYGSLGGAERLWWLLSIRLTRRGGTALVAAAPLRPRPVRGHRPGGVARAADRR